jgi:hypothetical protein
MLQSQQLLKSTFDGGDGAGCPASSTKLVIGGSVSDQFASSISGSEKYVMLRIVRVHEHVDRSGRLQESVMSHN